MSGAENTITPASERRYLTIREAAEILGVCDRTVRRLIAEDAFQTRTIRRRRKILKSSFERWNETLRD